MPKKSFKTNTSTVFVKRKKSGQIIKKNNLDKQCRKFILIDGNNEKNWKTLKTELGCKTDTSFLEHLLALARKELDSSSGKKFSSNAENENKIKKVLVIKKSSKNSKRTVNEDGSAWSELTDTGTTTNELEKAKEKDWTDSATVLFEENRSSFKFVEAKGIQERDSDRNHQIPHSYDYKRLSQKSPESESKSELTDGSKNLAQKTKTDFAKDLVLENNSIDIRKTLENISHQSVKTSTASEKSEEKKRLGKVEDDFLKGKKNRSKEKIAKHTKSNRKPKKRKGKSAESEERLGFAIKIKLCLVCNTMHVVGECRTDERAPSPIDFQKNREENVYDFNETEKNRCADEVWRPKTPGFRDRKDEEDFIEMNDGMDSDSGSDSETNKLRIDESSGENVSFAESSLPDYLELKILDEEHGPSVFTRVFLKKGTEFGPLVGQKIKEKDIPDDFDMKHIWEVNRGGQDVTYISTRDQQASNWLRYLRPAPSKESANLMGRTKDGSLVFRLTGDVPDGQELLYWTDDTHSAWSKKKLEKKNCGGCNLRFNHPLYYRKHCMIFHDPSCSLTIRKYHCKVCGVAVLGKEKIMKHAAEMHQGKGAYQCQFCLKFFLRLNYLEMHRTYGCSKNPQRSRPLCDLCGRKFCQPQKLKVHIKRMHSDMAQVLKDFQCKSCLKILGSRAALQRHMKEVHNKDIVGACTCDRCGKMFQNKSNLKIHMLTHSGVKPFKCQQPECSAAFTTKQCLQFHYKKVHGFSDGFIPKIERSIAYTFDAYSGGAISNPDSNRSSPKFEERNGSPSPSSSPIPAKVCGLDLSLVLPSTQDLGGNKSRSSDTPSPAPDNFESEENRGKSREPSSREASPPDCVRDPRSLPEPAEIKIIASKGSKKWLGPNEPSGGFKSIFKTENSDASLLVEAAISAAEKDIVPCRYEKESEDLMRSSENCTVVNQYADDDSPGPIVYEEKKPPLDECYEKRLRDSPEQSGKIFQTKSSFNDVLKSNTLLRISACPLNEIPKDYNVARDAETFNDIEIHDYPSREEAYKENDAFHEQYRIHDFYRTDKTDYADEFRPSSADKYRDIDAAADLYRNLEKYPNRDVYRLRSEIYDFGGAYPRDPSEERDGQVQNLCLKEKSLQYETLEELARIGRDNPGFECLLVGDSSANANPASLGLTRGFDGMPSPRSYHPAAYETESVDLSVPRPPYSSPPIYSLDLTRSRLHLPTSRDVDVTSHLGLRPDRFSNGRVAANGSSPVSPTDYSVYPSPYVTPAARPSPTSQFQPYTSLYY